MPIVSCYSSDGKVSWQPEAKDYHRVSLHNKLYTRELLGRKTKEGGCLGLDEEQSTTEQEVGFLGIGREEELSRAAWRWRDYLA